MALRKQPTSLINVLAALSSTADTFLATIGSCPHLRAARLSCKGLRALIDQHVRHLSITVLPEDVRLQAAGQQRPCLARWPSCSSLTLYLATNNNCSSSSIVRLLDLSGLPLLSRQRVTNLIFKGIWDHEALALVTSQLPNARHLDFHDARLSIGPRLFTSATTQLYAALAKLSRLEQLNLPSLHDLHGIEQLSALSTLRCLVAGPGLPWFRPVHQALAAPVTFPALWQLQHLTCLDLLGNELRLLGSQAALNMDAYDAPMLLALLNGLPPALQELRLRLRMGITAGDLYGSELALTLSGTMEARQFRHATIHLNGHLLPGPLSALLEVLPISQLHSLELPVVHLPGGRSLEQPESAFLHTLLRRCAGRVDMGRLVVASTEAAMEVGRLLGKPCHLSVMTPYISWDLRNKTQPPVWGSLRLPNYPHHQHHYEQGPQEQQQSSSAPGGLLAPLVPDAEVLARAVLEKLLHPSASMGPPTQLHAAFEEVDGSGCGGAEGGSLTSARGTDKHAVEQHQSDTAFLPGQYSPGVLLLHGAFVSCLIETPEALDVWVRCVGGRFKRAVDDAGPGKQPMRTMTHQVLPPTAAAVVLNMGVWQPSEDAVLAAVARSLEKPGGMLTVTPIPDWNKMGRSPYLCKLEEKLKAIWDEQTGTTQPAASGGRPGGGNGDRPGGWDSGGEGGSSHVPADELQLLQQLLEAARTSNVLPPPVVWRQL